MLRHINEGHGHIPRGIKNRKAERTRQNGPSPVVTAPRCHSTIAHALITIVLTAGVVAWAIVLWQRGAVTTGDVVLTCTLGLAIFHATRDLAVALVDVTQHVARLSEALGTLLVPHDMRDHPEATPLVNRAPASRSRMSRSNTPTAGVFLPAST